jgi:hypothetical protein
MCSLDSDCIPTLICPTVPGVCTCPTYLGDYVCNCPNTDYYDSTLLQCGMKIKNFLLIISFCHLI